MRKLIVSIFQRINKLWQKLSVSNLLKGKRKMTINCQPSQKPIKRNTDSNQSNTDF